MPETVRYIEKEEILEWIQRPGVRGYRYRPNSSISWFLILSGITTLALGALLTVQSGLALWVHKGGFAVLSFYTLWAFWAVGHWNLFAARNYLGVSDTELLVGRGPRAYVVPRSRLDRRTVAVESMQRGRLTSVLPIAVGTWKANIHLVGPFVNLQNVKQFIADILESILANDTETEIGTESGAASGTAGDSMDDAAESGESASATTGHE
jgi:hypothetical protein